MRKHSGLIFIVLAALALASCSHKEDITHPGTLEPIRFVLEENLYTVKSTDTSFENGDRMSLFVSSPVNVTNMPLSYSNGTLTTASPIYWAEGQTGSSTFTAIYPYDAERTSASDYTFTVQTEQSTRSAHCASDLMTASASAAPTSSPIVLKFTHAMSRLTINIDNRSGGEITWVSVSDFMPSCHMPSGEAFGERTEIHAYNSGNDRWEIIVPAQTAEPVITVYTTKGDFKFSMGGSASFVAGRNQSTRITVGSESPQPSGKIPGWFELPYINDANANGIDDADGSLYYAYHSFTMNSRKWRNFTVCFSADHHCAMWMAAPRHSCYEGSSGRSDAYKADPDIPSEYQYSSKDTGGSCNKGHLLGSAERTCCREANEQVFYYSNIAPQFSSTFNTGGGGWNILEDWVDGKVCADTLYEVVGCYYEEFTDGYGYTGTPATISFGGRNDVLRPTMFYYLLLRTKKGNTGKAVKDCAASELQCAAFVRSHNGSLKGQKVSAKEMMSVSDLEKITGFTYFTNVPNAPKDTFNPTDWGL
ncbi:MAG: fimbrillin family protein [Bacteroidales bacterium]|nr:fimbrillin family protein [Bacteroidales bacterium]